MPNNNIGKSERESERAHPEDSANAPGWDRHVEEFFNSEAFPGDGVRKATDAMREPRPDEQPNTKGGSSEETEDRESLQSGQVGAGRKTDSPPRLKPDGA